jgi:hypothetical protein
LQCSHKRAEHASHEFLEQALLVAEVEIDRALGDTGAAGDIVEARRCKPADGKFLERGCKNRFAPRRLRVSRAGDASLTWPFRALRGAPAALAAVSEVSAAFGDRAFRVEIFIVAIAI